MPQILDTAAQAQAHFGSSGSEVCRLHGAKDSVITRFFRTLALRTQGPLCWASHDPASWTLGLRRDAQAEWREGGVYGVRG